MDKKRKYCEHCESEVSKSTYYEHLALKEARVYHDDGDDDEFEDASVGDQYHYDYEDDETINFTSGDNVDDGKIFTVTAHPLVLILLMGIGPSQGEGSTWPDFGPEGVLVVQSKL